MNKYLKNTGVLFLIALAIGVSISFLTTVYIHKIGSGYVDNGYPISWQRVYGGVTTISTYPSLLIDIVLWTFAAFAILIFIFLGYYGEKKK